MTEISSVVEMHLTGRHAVQRFIPEACRILNHVIDAINDQIDLPHPLLHAQDPFQPFISKPTVCIDIILRGSEETVMVIIKALQPVYRKNQFLGVRKIETLILKSYEGNWTIRQSCLGQEFEVPEVCYPLLEEALSRLRLSSL